MKRADKGRLVRYTGARPKRSLRWGVMIGAKAMPRRYNDRPRIATVYETLNRVMTSVMPAV